MKSLIFFAILIFSFGSMDAAGSKPETVACADFHLGGSIVMEDAIMMLVTTDDGIITGITVETIHAQAVVYSSGGCGAASCSVNLGSLTRATYKVIVTTSTGASFSDTVVAGS